MEEPDIKTEPKSDDENVSEDTVAENSDSKINSKIQGDVKVNKKFRYEVDLDFTLVKNEYHKPRQRKKVTRYRDIVLAEENRRQKRKIPEEIKDNPEHSEHYCHICNHKFATIKYLKLHNQAKHAVTGFTCALCSATFTSNADLLEHKLVHKDEDRNFLCTICETAFTDHCQYLKHNGVHMSKLFYCIECGKEFTHRTSYYMHIDTHFATQVECQICNVKYNSNRKKQHLKTHTMAKVKCVECNKEYTQRYMEYHMCVHTGVKPYQCLYCGRGFGLSTQVRIHTRMHTGEKPHKCKLCHSRFVSSSDLKFHLEKHQNGVQKIKCEVCNKMLTKANYKRHMDIHTNTQEYECRICGKKVNTWAGLNSHLNRAHKEERNFKCVPCNVSFKTIQDLNKHKRWNKHKNNQYGYDLKNK